MIHELWYKLIEQVPLVDRLDNWLMSKSKRYERWRCLNDALWIHKRILELIERDKKNR